MNLTMKRILLLAAVGLGACSTEEVDTKAPEAFRLDFADPIGHLQPRKVEGINAPIAGAPASYTVLRVVFKELLDPTTVETLDAEGVSVCANAGNVALFDPDGKEMATEACYDPSLPGILVRAGTEDCVGFHPLASFDYTTQQRQATYTLVLGPGLKDANGNAFAGPKEISFTVGAGIDVVHVDPRDGVQDVALDAGITLTFSSIWCPARRTTGNRQCNAPRTGAADMAGIQLWREMKDGTSERVVYFPDARTSSTGDERALALFPYLTLTPDTNYEVRITPSFKDANGVPALPFSSRFRTMSLEKASEGKFEIKGDLSNPAANATGYARDLVDVVNSSIGNCPLAHQACTGGTGWYVANDELDPTTVSTDTVKFTKADGSAVPNYQVVVGDKGEWAVYNGPSGVDEADANRLIGVRLAMDSNGRTIPLDPDTEYKVEFKAGIKNAKGKAMEPNTLTFRTAGFMVGMPFVGGTATMTFPGPRATGVALRAPFVVPRPSSVFGGANRKIEVWLSEQVLDTPENLATVQFVKITSDGPQPVPGTWSIFKDAKKDWGTPVLGADPGVLVYTEYNETQCDALSDNQTLPDLNVPLREIDYVTNAWDLARKDAQEADPDNCPTLGTVLGLAGVIPSDVLQFRPEANLDLATSYQIKIGKDLKSLAGAALGAEFIAGFNTVAFNVADTINRDPFEPAVVPRKDATGVAVNGKIEVNFNSPVEFSTVTPESFSVRQVTGETADGRDVYGPSVEGAFAPSGDAKVIFTPAAPLKAAATYRVLLTSSLKSSAGTTNDKKVLAAAFQWKFKTACP